MGTRFRSAARPTAATLSPPLGHYPGSCTNCHADANAAGTALTGSLHMNGAVVLGDGSGLCGACHGTGASPWPTTAAHPGHQNPTITLPIACASCHPVPSSITDPTHLDGIVQVTFTGLALARGASPVWNGTSCTNVACHGANLADPAGVPVWTDPSGDAAECGACHGIPPFAAHDVHVVQPERLPRRGGRGQRAGGAVDLGERPDASHRRHHRALRGPAPLHFTKAWHPVQTCACGWWSSDRRGSFPCTSRGRATVRLVRRVARGAVLVRRDRVERGERPVRVARRARRGLRDAARAVRSVAGEAAVLHCVVRSSGLVRVARRAGRRRNVAPAVWLVATEASLVPLGRARLALCVAGPARRRRLRLVRRGAVARRAVGVPRVRRRERALLRVAARAEGELVRGGSKSCGLWQLVHGMPPACAPVSVGAIAAWQLVQRLAACGFSRRRAAHGT